MTEQIWREWRFMKAVILVTYKDWAAYKSHMALTMFLTPAQLMIQYYIWKAVYSGNPDFGGMDMDGMILYFIVTSTIGLITFDFAEWNTQMLIRTGKMTTFLLRPISHVRFAFYQKVGHRILSFWIEVIPAAVICLLFFHVRLSAVYPVWALVSVSLGFLISFFINYTVGCLAFWFANTDGIAQAVRLVSAIAAGTYFPLILLPKPVQNLLFCLPFQFTSYLPVQVFLGSYQLGGIRLEIPQAVAVQGFVAAVMFVINRLVWRAGVKRNMGVGV